MTKARRTSGAAVLPLVAAAVGIGVGATPADAAICSPLSSASITGPSETITAGSTVHVSARVSGMLLSAHMQITGPGLDQQVGSSAISGVIKGDVRVPEPGVFTLKVVGNGTGCVYDTDTFSVKERPAAATPSPHGSAGASGTTGATRTSRLAKGLRDGAGRDLRTPRSNGPSPFRLPPVAPDGTGPSVHLPSADPQVAAPPVRQPQPQADNAAETVPPIKWGQSIAIALVLLLLSAHMGMWSRRQRLAEAGGRRGRGARRANASPQIIAQLPFASDRPAAPGDRDHLTKSDDGHAPLASAAAYTGTQQQLGHGQESHMLSSDRSGTARTAGHAGLESRVDPRSHAGTAGQSGWDELRRQAGRPDPIGSTSQHGREDGRSQVPGQSGLLGPAGEPSPVDWESWVGTRRRMNGADRANFPGWVDAADRDGRAGSGNQDPHAYPGGEMGDQPRPYPVDRSARPGRVEGDPGHGDQADTTGWPVVSGDGGLGAAAGGGSLDRGEPAVSAGRATRSGRGAYRGRRRRS